MIGISVGAIGTVMAEQYLRNVLAYLDMPALGQPEAFFQNKEGLFNADGSIREASRTFLQGWMERFLKLVVGHAK